MMIRVLCPHRRSVVVATARFAIAMVCAVAAPAARAEDPLAVVRAFCREDGDGNRISPITWRRSIAPLVTWQLEPAWDHIVLVRGYDIKTPRHLGSRIEVEVTYGIAATVTPRGIEREQREQTLILDLLPTADGRWLIGGAPHPPHLFEHVADPAALAELLAPGSSYESNSQFVARILESTGVVAPYTTTTDIPGAEFLEEVGTAAAGDLVVYFGQGIPYHVGWMESDERVLSATLNAGRRALPFAAFPGSIRYWRPRGQAASATPPPSETSPVPSPLRRR